MPFSKFAVFKLLMITKYAVKVGSVAVEQLQLPQRFCNWCTLGNLGITPSCFNFMLFSPPEAENNESNLLALDLI